MGRYIDVESRFVQYLPASMGAYCREGLEAPLFSITFAEIADCEITVTPFQCVRSVGQWKGFSCEETLENYCFAALDNKCYYVYVSKSFDHVTVMVSDFQSIKNNRSFQEILQYAYQVRLLHFNCLLSHAAAVIYNNQCIAFSGDSGAGKSTQARLWEKYLGAEVINFDKPGISIDDSGVNVFGTPFGGKENITKENVAPLKAIIFVKQHKENRIERLKFGKAFAALYAHYMLYPIDEHVISLYEGIVTKLVLEVPVYNLYCDISSSAVACVLSEVFQETMAEKGHDIVRISDNYALRNIAGEYVAFARGKAALDVTSTIVMNESSAFLWRLLENEISVEALTQALMKEYEIDYQLAARDVKAFLQQLDENEVLIKGDINVDAN